MPVDEVLLQIKGSDAFTLPQLNPAWQDPIIM